MAEQTKDLYQASPVKTIEGKPIGAPVRIIDPDTIKSGDTSYRLHGFNAPETAKLQGGIFVPNQVVDDQSQRIVNRIATEGGFTNLEPVGSDPYGRVVAKQTNNLGQDLGDTLTVMGLFNPTLYTDNQVVQDAISFQAAESLLPSLGDTDPLVRASREEKENRIKLEGNPAYAPKMAMHDERQYAAVKNMTGIPAVKSELEEISRLENILATETLSNETRDKLRNKLEESQQRLYLAATTPDIAGNVLYRHGDRNMMNQAHDQFSTSFKYATLDMLSGLGGIMEMTGEAAQWEWLKEKGQAQTRQIKFEQGDMASTLSSFKDIRTDDPWDAVSDTATYVGNLAAGTLPMMSLIIGSTLATGGLGLTGALAYGVSSVPPSLMYAGQFYADQEDDKKNAALAMSMGIASGILDKVGLDGMVTAANPLTKTGRDLVVNNIVAKARAEGRNVSIAEARNMLLDASKKELVELSKVGSEFARQQYKSREAKLRLASSFASKIAAESSTETMQQAAQMLAETGEWNTDVQYEKEFYQSLLDAAVGGGVMAGTIAMGGAAIDTAGWQSAADALDNYKKNLTDAQRFNLEQSDKGIKSIRQAANTILSSNNQKSLKDFQKEVGGGGAWNAAKSIVTDPLRLVRQLVDTAIPSITKEDGTFKTNLAYIKAIMGGAGILPGDNYAGLKQRLIGSWAGNNAEELASALNTNVYDAEKLVKRSWNNVWSKGQRLQGTSPQEIALQEWKDQIDNTTASMKATAAEAGIDLPELLDPDAMFTDVTTHPKLISNNKDRLVEHMVNNGANRRQAYEAVDNIISGNPTVAQPAKDFMRNYGVFSDDKFNNLFEPNIFTSMENLKGRIADRISDSVLLGKDGKTLANLIQNAIEAGEFESEAEMRNTIKEVTDWYDIIQGDYKPLDKYPVLNKVISWGTTLTMLASLGKAALSSIPEAAFATLGTQGKYVTDQINDAVKMTMQEYKSDINNFASWTTAQLGISVARQVAHSRLSKKIDKLEKEYNDLIALGNDVDPAKLKALSDKVEKLHREDLGRSLFERLGYNETGYNTQAKFEVGSVNNNMRKTMQVFSAVIGLRSITDGVRIAALTVASDIVISKITNLRSIPAAERDLAFRTAEGLSNSQAQDLRDLMEFGMNVPAVIKQLEVLENMNVPMSTIFSKDFLKDNSVDSFEHLRNNILTTLGNMVDSKITHPQAHNMPKYYHDPRLRLVTVMTRFVGAFTSNILPRLYRRYLIEGNTGMRYQAFSVIAMSLALAAMANVLKDELAYGDDNPYLTTTREKVQRAVYGSGLLGRYEAIVDAVMPLYPFRKAPITSAPGEALYGMVKDISPVASYGDRIARTAAAISEGDTETAIKRGSRVVPVMGSFPVVGNTLSEVITDLFKE